MGELEQSEIPLAQGRGKKKKRRNKEITLAVFPGGLSVFPM